VTVAILVAATQVAPGAHLRTDSTVQDLLNHPAFAGFARLLLPWDDRTYDGRLRLRDVGTLLPYHTGVDPPSVVGALNAMIDDVHGGKPVFYDIYTGQQKAADPAKANTGLFFYRGRPGAPFAVIAPGGGFAYVASVHEGFPYAVAIRERGYNAFVLKYRVGAGGSPATRDMAAAVSYIFRNARSLGVSTEGYSVWGSSAGARMAVAIGSHGTARFGGDDVPKPSAVIMAYTGHVEVAAHEPRTFVAVGEHDGIASPSTMEQRAAAVRATGADVVFHRYPGLGHGFGPGIGTSAEGWLGRAVDFWEKAPYRRRASTGASRPLRRRSSSSSVRGQSFFSSRESARSASRRPSVWHVAQ
jgi:acetyl esterase/lipase